MIKGSVQQEDTTLINIYAPNTGAPKYKKLKALCINLKYINTKRHKREIDNNTIIVGDLNTPLTSMDRSSR